MYEYNTRRNTIADFYIKTGILIPYGKITGW